MGATSSTRRRRGRTNGSHTLSPQDMMDMFIRQQGVCALSRAPLSLDRGSEWRMSLERFDNEHGYSRSNCGLICAGFQSSDRTSRACYPNAVLGSSQWSANKCDLLVDWV